MFLLLLVGLVAVVRGEVTSSLCRCAPEQWEGELHSVEHEYDVEEGELSTAYDTISLTYDFTNTRFAMTDLNSGSRIVADYARVSTALY